MSEHRPIADQFCGQPQPHDAHEWHTPPVYGAVTFTQTYQCAGASAAVQPGPCNHQPGFSGPTGATFACELLAGHAGAHTCDRGTWGGSAVWEDDERAEESAESRSA